MLQARRVAALPGRQPGCQFLQPAERAARLGQLRLARRRLRPGLQIRPRELAEQRTHLVERDGVRVEGLVRPRAWAPAAGGDRKSVVEGKSVSVGSHSVVAASFKKISQDTQKN